MDESEPELDEMEPVVALQNTLGQIGGDSMAVGFACVVEWLEPDGSNSVQVYHTDMPPWHLKGLLEWGIDMSTSFFYSTADSTICDGDDDDD